MKINPGIIPTFASSGVITPGQFGPTNVQSLPSMYAFTFTISAVGIPSVIQMITLIPASADSIIASAAKAGGTKIMEVSAPTFSTDSLTVLNTGFPRCSCPPFPGVTPPTTFVP